MITVINEAKSNEIDMDSWQVKELQKLGVNFDNAEYDGSDGIFVGKDRYSGRVRIDRDKLDKLRYKYIETNSSDYTQALYTNGKYVVSSVASSYGYVSIYKLGPKAKKMIDLGEPFDILNHSLQK